MPPAFICALVGRLGAVVVIVGDDWRLETENVMLRCCDVAMLRKRSTKGSLDVVALLDEEYSCCGYPACHADCAGVVIVVPCSALWPWTYSYQILRSVHIVLTYNTILLRSNRGLVTTSLRKHSFD